MGKFIDLTGKTFTKLTVIGLSPNRRTKARKRMWLCRCECGNEKEIIGDNLRSGTSKSCGCSGGKTEHRHASYLKNGHSKYSPTYLSWQAMKSRCLNKNHSAYERYGAQGISVCNAWMTFSNFLLDMGERPEGTTLDRIDGTKGYAPDNCRWATNVQQYMNKRVNRDPSGKFTKEK